jgi:predicted small lipoprotein YifL
VTSRLWLLGIPLLLAGCGLRTPLEPPPGETLPPAPPAAARPLTAEELLTPPPIARPERVDELLRRSEEREQDRFDLPPAEVPPGGDTIDPQESDPQA